MRTLRILSPRLHAPLDYGLVAAFALAPTLLGLGGIAATLCYAIAAVVLLGTLTTAYPGGVVKIVPFVVHGYAELASAVLFIAMPFVFGFGDHGAARNFFIIMGAGTIAVVILTDYRTE